MGTGKILKEHERAFTVIGTPHYMAPETLRNKGYTCLADLWSIGIILFEMVYGYYPLADELDDPYSIYQSILGDKIDFPEDNEEE